MKSKLRKLKREAMPFIIMFLMVDIIIIGSVNLAFAEAKAENITDSYQILSHVLSDFLPNIVHFKFIIGIFKDIGNFLNLSMYTLIVFVILFIAWKIKFAKTSEYQDIENGSSDWAKDGEEFDKLDDGREILNRKHGFILSKTHYLGTDLKKVLINKNILVVGRIWCW